MYQSILKQIIVLIIFFNVTTIIQSNPLKTLIPLQNEYGNVILCDTQFLPHIYNNNQKYQLPWILGKQKDDGILIEDNVIFPREAKRFARIGGSIVMGR